MEAVFWLEDYLAGWSKILFFVAKVSPAKDSVHSSLRAPVDIA